MIWADKKLRTQVISKSCEIFKNIVAFLQYLNFKYIFAHSTKIHTNYLLKNINGLAKNAYQV